MEKYYNSFDRLFITDDFKGEFTDINGNKHSGTITGASVYIATIGINRRTGKAEYNVNNTNEAYFENTLYDGLFKASINAEVGILIIPNVEAIAKIEKKTGLLIAGKIEEYTIDMRSSEGIIVEPHTVTEMEFVRFIKEHFDKFDNSDNYFAQSTSYCYYKVE